MLRKRVFTMMLLQVLIMPVLAQTADTLTAAEITLLEQGMKNSSFGYFYKADSFSRRKDSLNAGKWLMKINPYYMSWLCKEPKTTADIYKHLLLTDSVKEKYTQLYESALAAKSEPYARLQEMKNEDQHIRELLEKCDDSITCAIVNKRMRYTDSVHFDYLYNYVSKNGWPSINDGSLYACLIAIHDHPHHDFYIEAIKKGIIAGQAPFEPLKLLYAWKQHRGPVDLKRHLDTSRKRVFNVSSLMKQQLPSSLPRIRAVMKNNCDAKFYVTVEVRNQSDYDKWTAKFFSWRKHDVLEQLFDTLKDSCPKRFSKSDRGIWDVCYWPMETTQERMMLYIVFDDKKKK